MLTAAFGSGFHLIYGASGVAVGSMNGAPSSGAVSVMGTVSVIGSDGVGVARRQFSCACVRFSLNSAVVW